MSHRMGTELVINSLKMSYYKTNPDNKVILHSDQWAQFSSFAWQIALKTYHIKPSMSRRGNCYDNAVVESFFKTLKKKAVKKQIFITRKQAKSTLFVYFEKRYNQNIKELEVLTE